MSPLFAKFQLPSTEEYAVGGAIAGLFMFLIFLGVVGIGKWLTYVIDGPSDRRRTRQ